MKHKTLDDLIHMLTSTRLEPRFQISHFDLCPIISCYHFVVFFCSFIELITDYPYVLLRPLDPHHS